MFTTSYCGCVPTVHCCGVTRLSAPPRMPSQSWPFSSQEGGTLQDGARSVQCTCCHFAACVGVAAGSQPAATLLFRVLCSAHTRASASPAHTSRCRVWPLYIVSMASRAELCIKRHSTIKKIDRLALDRVRWLHLDLVRVDTPEVP